MSNKLREVRVIRRISQFQLRLSTGIHQSKISLIENGLIEPQIGEKKKLAKALGVRPVDIWSDYEGETRVGSGKQFEERK